MKASKVRALDNAVLGLQCVAVCCLLLLPLYFALSVRLYVPTFHLDGAFQTASGLYRLWDGQSPGRDFFPYLGIGPLYLLYPLFAALGANLTASSFSAQFVTTFLSWISMALIWHLVLAPRRFVISLMGGGLLLFTPIVLARVMQLPLPDAIQFACSPGNSLRPIRAAAPYLVMLTYHLALRRVASVPVRVTCAAVLTGCTLLWSNDFAIPTAGLFSLFLAFSLHRRGELTVPGTLVYFLVTAAVWLSLLMLVTRGHGIDLLLYNFRDVAQDQWWYYAPYAKTSRIFGPLDLWRLVNRENLYPLLVLLVLLAVLRKSRREGDAELAVIGTVLLAGGMLACIGGHLDAYFSGFYLWSLAVTATLLIRWARERNAGTWLQRHRMPPVLGTPAGLTCLGLVLCVAGAGMVYREYRAERAGLEAAVDWMQVPELGGHIHRDWSAYLDLARHTPSRRVAEEYWGLWSALHRVFPPWPVDSVIHALGETRKRTAAGLGSTDVMISTRYRTSIDWQPWNVTQNFWFYEELLRNWQPVGVSPATVVWKRLPAPREFVPTACAIGSTGRQIMVDVPAKGFYRVTLDYAFEGKGRHLLFIKNRYNFGADSGGYMSLDPKAGRAVFPAFFDDEGRHPLRFRVYGNPDFKLSARGCTAARIPFDYDEVLRSPSQWDPDFFLTDANWESGVARRWAGFFVQVSDATLTEFVTGRTVRLGNGEDRKIVRTRIDRRYLNVDLEGQPFTPAVAGHPSTYTVHGPLPESTNDD